MRPRVTSLAAVIVCLVAACHRSQPTGDESPSGARSWVGFGERTRPILVGHSVKPDELTATELKFGVAPKQIAGLVYQPGIVVMEDGDRRVRAVNSSGLGCTFDATSPQLAQLQIGKIVFATSRCVGRVLSLQRQGAEVAVVLGPVQLTDLIKEGNFSFQQPIDLAAMILTSEPDYPGAVNSEAARRMHANTAAAIGFQGAGYRDAVWHPATDSSAGFLRTQDIPLPGLPGLSVPQMPVSAADIERLAPGPAAQLINGMQMESCRGACGNLTGSGLGLKLYQDKDGVRIWVNAIMELPRPTLDFKLSISGDAKVNARVILSGIAAFKFEFAALAGADMTANLHEVGAIPMSISLPIGGMGVPFTAQFQQSIRVDSQFRARTSLLRAAGDFSVSGDVRLEYINGSWNVGAPFVRINQNLAQSVGGLSVGINELSFGTDQRLLVGVGELGFAAGPYVQLLSTLGARKSASLAFDCRVANFKMQLGGGLGYGLPIVVANAINFFLNLLHIDPVPPTGTIVALKDMATLIDRDDYWPKNDQQKPCNAQ